jgi:hypothetical protein
MFLEPPVMLLRAANSSVGTTIKVIAHQCQPGSIRLSQERNLSRSYVLAQLSSRPAGGQYTRLIWWISFFLL